MGEVAIVYRIMPEDINTDINKLRENVLSAIKTKKNKLQEIKIKDIAFGIWALEATLVIPDEEGVSDEIEKVLSLIDGVQSVEVVDMGRLL